MEVIIHLSYFAAAVLFILGLKQMSSPKTARKGIIWAGAGMVVATVVTYGYIGKYSYVDGIVFNVILATVAIGIGTYIAWTSAKRVAMTDMPQMVALYNGMGGGSAAAIAAIALMQGHSVDLIAQTLAVLGAFIGSVAFTGSLIAYAKLQGLTDIKQVVPNQSLVNLGLFALTVIFGIILCTDVHQSGWVITLFFIAALVLGAFFAIPIGGADMPVVISLFNAFTGLAVAFEGFVIQNPAMIIAGTVVGSAGLLLTQLMATAMNRSITNILFSGFGDTAISTDEADGPAGTMKETDATDAAITMAYSDKVIIVPGYGMAVAQAQHKVWELADLLTERGVNVKFAIHPVAGRMPGHMNVLLAEAGVPYDMIEDLDEINSDFPTANMVLVIGANDVVNPIARTEGSEISGMPILDADKAENVVVIKRGRGTGYSGIENHLFYADNTRMLYGDAQEAVTELIAGIKAM